MIVVHLKGYVYAEQLQMTEKKRAGVALRYRSSSRALNINYHLFSMHFKKMEINPSFR